MRRDTIGGKDHQLGIVGVAPDNFFTPVTEEISRQGRYRFGAIIGGGVIVASA